jgi:peptide/nickel transport system substrate-binding protein
VLLLTVALLLSACAGRSAPPTPTPLPTPAPPPRPVDTLRLVYWQTPRGLNPHLTIATRDLEPARLIYEPLASVDKNNQLTPILAAEIPSLENGLVAPDLTSVTWKLKQGVTWSDGEPFTADDVRFTWEFATAEGINADSGSVYNTIQDVEVIDDYTARVVFRFPTLSWDQPYVGLRGMILPRHVFEPFVVAGDRAGALAAAPIGTGPYVLQEFRTLETLFLGYELVATNKLVFAANPTFREAGKPYFQRIEWRGGGTADEAARLVLAPTDVDGADYAWNLTTSPELLAELEARGAGRVLTNLGPFVERISINSTDPNPLTGERSDPDTTGEDYVMRDPLVREAISLAIDRERIVQLFPPGSVVTSNIIVAPEVYNSTNTALPYDPERAEQLLDQAGWVIGADGIRERNGVKLRLIYQASANKLRQQTQQIVAESLRRIGVAIEIVVIDPNLYTDRTIAETNLYRFYAHFQQLFFGNVTTDPMPILAFWTCAQIPRAGNGWQGSNFERFCNPEFDALFAEAQREIDPERRRALIIRMNDLIVDSIAAIPLVRRSQASVVANSIEGVDLTPWDADVWNIKDWRRIAP